VLVGISPPDTSELPGPGMHLRCRRSSQSLSVPRRVVQRDERNPPRFQGNLEGLGFAEGGSVEQADSAQSTAINQQALV
jgi:hypothetical protein